MSTPICDYEGSGYREEFWGQGRQYEDAAERHAMRALVPAPAGSQGPATGGRLLEIGAGYGRLADLYAGYREVYLLDYARTQVEQAQEHLAPSAGRDRARRGLPGFTYVVGDIYGLPFVDGFFDTVVTVRVLHHIADVPAALAQVARVLRGGGAYVLEYANKLNLKARLRYALGRQPSPYTPEPWEFVKLNYNFHPAYMERSLAAAGFAIGAQRSVSLFRVGLLKRLAPAGLLAGLDGLLQAPLAGSKPGPSVFLVATLQRAGAATGARQAAQGDSGPDLSTDAARVGAGWRCPTCRQALPGTVSQYQTLDCPTCGARWNAAGGIYDFKTPVSPGSGPSAEPSSQ